MILDRFRVDGKVALVTGAGKGIGAAIALALAEAGADVLVAARTQADVDAVAGRIEAIGRRAVAVSTDVMVDDQRERAVRRALDELGRLDILVNNAGGSMPKHLMSTSERSMEIAFRFNVLTAFAMTKLCVPHLAATGNGAILNISSRAASMVQPAFVAYATAKAALSMMTRAMAPELAPKIRINAIEVGGVNTGAYQDNLPEDFKRELEANTPMRRLGEPEDIAAAALYLLSGAGEWVTGKIFAVDGGTESPTSTIPFEPL